MRLYEAVHTREPDRPEAALPPEDLLARFRAADPTRNGACLPWLLRTYSTGGYRLEDLSKAHDTLIALARLRGQLPNTATIDGEVRNPRKLGSHVTLASLWSVISPLVEAERLAQEDDGGEQENTNKKRALSQSRVIHRSARMVIAVPLTEEASCWWGQGTQWCTAARKNNAFEHYHKRAPLIVICLRKSDDLPARKLQLHIHASGMQFMDENDARVSPELILERWQDLVNLVYWALSRNGLAIAYVPEPLRTEAICSNAVDWNGQVLSYVPKPLRTEAICLTAVGRDGWALAYVPEYLCTEAICLAAVEQNGQALFHVPEPLQTKAVCSAAVSMNGETLKYVPEPLRTEAMCTTAVGRNGGALQYVPEPLRTEAICLAAVGSNRRALHYVPEHLRAEAICITAVGRDGWALVYVPEIMRTEAICTAAVARNGQALVCVPEPLRTEAMCTTAVGNNGLALAYVPEPLRTEAMCTTAVGRNGVALAYVPEPLRTEVLCLAAVGSNKRALQYVPESLGTEMTRLTAVGGDKQKTVSLIVENNRELHELLLESLESYLKTLHPSRQNTVSIAKLGIRV